MVGCSRYCLEMACCHVCTHCRRDQYGAPCSCELYIDKEHQSYIEDDGCCDDFQCINATKPDHWVELHKDQIKREK